MLRRILSTICFLVLVHSPEAEAQSPPLASKRILRQIDNSRSSAPAFDRRPQGRLINRCGYGDDNRCDRQNELDIAGRLRQMEHQERSRLGEDYCLYHKDEPRCRHVEAREAERSGLELQKFCNDNSDAPRCIGYNLAPRARVKSGFFEEKGKAEEKRRDDFFDSSLGKPLPEPDEIPLFGD